MQNSCSEIIVYSLTKDIGSKFMGKFQKKNITIDKIIVFAVFVLSTILFFFNSKVILEVDTNNEAEGNISYITPFCAEFKKSGVFPFKVNHDNKIYTIPINAKLIKKIKVDFKINENNTVIIIKNVSIKFPYLPAIFFQIQGPQILDMDNSSVFFSDISIVPILIPILLFFISVACFIFLFFKRIKSILLSLREYNRIFIGTIILIILFEIVKFTGMYSNLLGNNITMFLYIFKSDSYFLSIFLILLYVAVQVRSKYISLFIMLILFAMLVILVLDIALIELLSARLRFTDASNFIPDISSVIKMAKGFFITSTGIYSIILLVYVIFFSIYIVRNKNLYQFSKPYKIVIFTLIIIFAPLFMIKLNVKSYYGTALQDSIIVANMKKTEHTLYSQGKIDEIIKNFKLEYNCINGQNSRKNIIVLVVESLSSFNSKFFSGIEDKTPNIDSIAKNNIYALNYYCNSYNSYQNRYNILTGSPLITGADNYPVNYNIFYDNSIVRDFQAKNYNVEYYSAADTFFDGTVNIVRLSGIKNLYDANSDIFHNIKRRFVFKGVEDKDFYDIVLNKINTNNKNKEKPYLAFITTMSTHGPYEDPETGAYSFDKTLKYADKQVSYFVDMLKKYDFFQNGILVITSDHRVMLPISEKEYSSLGQLAHANIPLILINNNEKYEIKGNFSHVDLGKSLEYLTLDKVCFNQFQRNIFQDNLDGCVIYQQLIDLSLVDVKCGNGYGQVILDGDNTRFIKDNLNIDVKKKNEIIQYINYLRLAK